MCRDMEAHTLNIFLPVKVHVNARQSVCLYFPQPLLKKIKVFSLPQISLYLKMILEEVYGSLVYFGQMQRSISELLPVIKGTDDVEQIHGPCPISLHFTRHPSSKP